MFILSLFSKATSITYPLVLFAYDLYIGRKLNFKMVVDKIPFFMISGIFGLIHLNIHVAEVNLTDPKFDTLGWLTYLWEAVVHYISSFAAPLFLSVIYETNTYHVSQFQYIAAAVFTIITLVVIVDRSKRNAAIFGLVFAGITIFPTFQIIRFGNGFKFADRYLFIPSMGLV
ncbi:MAG: hypothetical protein SGI74_10735 [Oligoflexia bacterium]|nr:hypothetical protein [Oligoflexia bacterium]